MSDKHTPTPRYLRGKRCRYCDLPAVVSFSTTSWVSSRGQRRAVTVVRGACAEHEGCSNWLSLLALFSPTLQRVSA